ncbi:Ldh family oxidoreductase [Pseudonocardia bannensis]|uniref:Ldh family oxidoreductase n=1 Tax=Pseudonocardia bannensis TaxID=630973 RepID=A0A848DMA6_9PSEU|nr:Ldh family oxidoreductase [Pseudonocardia bannensis]NMH93897.1 Ldh family oxidoreductase [Pseudonocardia bannensis]
MAEQHRVPADEHRRLTVAVLERLGTPPVAARAQADMLLEGDLRGHASHGLRRLDVLVGRVRAGLIAPAADPVLTWRTPSVLVVEGRRGFGPPTAHRAVDALLDRVVETGVAVAAIRDAGHLGMLAPYVERMAERGVLGLATTTSEALVHPWGAAPAMLGTNPLAAAIPTGDNGSGPIVLDMATGQVSRGKVLDHAARGVALPEGAVVDAEGRPTTDAAAALNGAISPFGGPKGYALSLVLEALVATLTGTALGRDVRGTLDTTDPCTKGDVLIALDPVAFGAGDRAPLQAFLTELRGLPPAPGHAGVTVPGDRAQATRRRNLDEGVPVDPGTWQRAREIAGEVGIPPAAVP